MSMQEAPRLGRFDGLKKLIHGEPPALKPEPAKHERWQVEEWKRLLAARTPEEVAAQGSDPKYLVRHPLVIPETYREGSVASFTITIGNPAFTEDLTRDGEWSAGAYVYTPGGRGIDPFGTIICRPGTDRASAIKAADEWIHANCTSVLKRVPEPFDRPNDEDPSGFGKAIDEHYATFVYEVTLPPAE
jgi:hypothetical protein